MSDLEIPCVTVLALCLQLPAVYLCQDSLSGQGQNDKITDPEWGTSALCDITKSLFAQLCEEEMEHKKQNDDGLWTLIRWILGEYVHSLADIYFMLPDSTGLELHHDQSPAEGRATELHQFNTSDRETAQKDWETHTFVLTSITWLSHP